MATTQPNSASRFLVFQDGSAHKFWRIELEGNSHTVCYGRVGAKGQTQTKAFDSDDAATASFDKLVAQKLKKGYSDAGTADLTSNTTAQSASAVKGRTKGRAAKSKTGSASNAIEAKGSPAPEVCITEVTRTIELEPEDWFRARYRPRQKLERGEARPFDKEQCVALLSNLKTNYYGWETKWSGLKLPAALSKEEAHFWLTAMTTDRDRHTKMSAFAERIAKQKIDGKISLAEAHKLIGKVPRSIQDYIALVLANLFSAEEIVDLMFMEPTNQRKTWHDSSDLRTMIESFSRFVVPYLSDDDVTSLSKRVDQALDPQAEVGEYEPLPVAHHLAASLGMHKQILQVTRNWEDDYFQKNRYANYYHNAQALVTGLASSELVESEWRRLKLRMLFPEHARAFLACTEYAALDVVADAVCQQTNREDCEKFLKVLLLVKAPEAAEPVLQCKLECKTPALARDWLDTNVVNAVQGLIETAGGDGKLADGAIEYLRSVKRRGLETLIADALKKAGKSEAAAKVKSDVLDHEEKVYESHDAKSTPKWLNAALSQAVSGKKKLPSWVIAANLPPLIVEGKRLNDDHVTAILHTLAATTITDKNELLSTLRDKIDKNIRDDFAWKLFQHWHDDGGPNKDKWAMGAIGHLGDDGCVLKLTPLIRAWPGESQHPRAVFGLECLRAVGSSVALMQLSGMAQKLKFKGLKSKAAQFVNEIAKDRGMTSDELEDRVVPDCGLDESGKRDFSFGSRTFSFVLGGDLKAKVRDESGKIRADLPKPNAKDDEAIATASVAAWKFLKKQIKDVATIQSRRLENAMITGRRWSQSDFTTLLVEHPLMTHLAQKLIWATFNKKGNKTSTFRITEEKDYADTADDAFTLPKTDSVGLVHPLELTDQDRATWGEVLSDYEIISPFAQLGRDVYTLEKGEDSLTELTRFKGLELAAPTMIFTLEKLDWVRGLPMDAGVFNEHSKQFPAADVTVVIDSNGCVGMGFIDPDEQLKLETVYFCPGLREPSGWESNDKKLKLGNVNPIVISEVLADLQVLQSKTR